jgi:beta-1,4-mannooligosaccharide/beta-1,4-mannosyl-N-acetylglucosamine phosphorylase
MIANALSNLPWLERSALNRDRFWRDYANPNIPRHLLLSSNSIFSSAVVPLNRKFAGVLRCDNRKRWRLPGLMKCSTL